MSTIFALASARGRAGLAVVRISGPNACAAVMEISGKLPPVRQVARRKLRWNDVILDDALVVWFAEGSSFTGEEVVELYLHGGVATVTVVLGALADQPGLRLAEPGEFTRRAFENGKMGLTEVEGLADLIDAETEAQRKQALRVLSGAIRDRVELWRRDLVRAVALLEATIDFADEEVPFDVTPEVRGVIDGLTESLHREVSQVAGAERVRDGFEIAIVGPTNVGKSTLLNALAGREAAITADTAGTTRDVIEVRMDLAGLPVTFLDTAGFRTTTDEVERIGIRRAIERAKAADLRVFLLDEQGLDSVCLEPEPQDIVVWGKADLGVCSGLAVSGKTGEGLDEIIRTVVDILIAKVPTDGVMTRQRHRIAILEAIAALESAQVGLKGHNACVEVVSENLRAALRALEIIVGRVDVEDFLGEIFASFCIGK